MAGDGGSEFINQDMGLPESFWHDAEGWREKAAEQRMKWEAEPNYDIKTRGISTEHLTPNSRKNYLLLMEELRDPKIALIQKVKDLDEVAQSQTPLFLWQNPVG